MQHASSKHTKILMEVTCFGKYRAIQSILVRQGNWNCFFWNFDRHGRNSVVIKRDKCRPMNSHWTFEVNHWQVETWGEFLNTFCLSSIRCNCCSFYSFYLACPFNASLLQCVLLQFRGHWNKIKSCQYSIIDDFVDCLSTGKCCARIPYVEICSLLDWKQVSFRISRFIFFASILNYLQPTFIWIFPTRANKILDALKFLNTIKAQQHSC